MATIDNYSFICVENERMRFARPNDMNDPKRKIIIVGTLCGSQNDKTLQIIEVERYEKTYIVGKYRSFNSIYYIGKKSKEMKGFERMIRENIPVITSFRIGYAYKPEAIGKHIPCIIGKVEHEKDEQIIYVEKQNFEENTITDINGRKYFIDWLSMDPRQYQNLVAELNNKFPKKLKKYFMSFCGKGLKFDMIALNDSLPILGVAGAFKIK